MALTTVLAAPLPAQTPPPTAVVFTNVRIFDGKSAALQGPSNVLVRGNRIERTCCWSTAIRSPTSNSSRTPSAISSSS